MSDFADSEFDYRGAAIYPGPPSSTTSDNSKVVEVLYKSKKTTRGLFKKKSKEFSTSILFSMLVAAKNSRSSTQLKSIRIAQSMFSLHRVLLANQRQQH